MKKKMQPSVFGVFENKTDVEHAVELLKHENFRNSDISILMPNTEATESVAHENATRVPEGAAVGAVGGFAVGGALGWLAGIGILAIPGIGPILAAGPIAAAIAGAGVGGAIGGMSGALVGIGIPEYEAKRYEGLIKKGGILMSIHVDDHEWEDLAKEVLQNAGAIEVVTTSEEITQHREIFGRKSGERDVYPPPLA